MPKELIDSKKSANHKQGRTVGGSLGADDPPFSEKCPFQKSKHFFFPFFEDNVGDTNSLS